MIYIKTDMTEMPRCCACCFAATEKMVSAKNGAHEREPYCNAVNKFTDCPMWLKPYWCPLVKREDIK